MEIISIIYLVILVIALVISLSLAVHSLRFWEFSGGKSFFALALAVAIAISAFLLFSLSQTPEQAWFWARVRFIGTAALPPFLFLFTLNYTGRRSLSYPYIVVALAIIPIMTQFVVWSDLVIPHFFTEWSTRRVGFLLVERSFFGGWFTLYVTQFYLLIAASFIMLFIHARRSSPPIREQTSQFLLSLTIGLSIGAIPVFIGNILPINLVPISFAITLAGGGWSIFRHRLIDALPAAYTTVFLNLQDAVIILNNHHEIIQLNYAAQALFSGNNEALRGQSIDHIWSDSALKQHLTTPSDSYFEMKLTDHIFDTKLSVLRAINGKDLGKILLLHDITERHRIEDDLRASNHRYDVLVESIPAVVYQTRRHPNGTRTFDYVSPRVRQINNLEPEDVLKNPKLMYDQIHPEGLPSFYAIESESMRTLSPFVWEGRNIVNGHTKWLHLESHPTQAEDGTIVWNGIALDITAQKETEIALQRSQKFASRIAQMVPDAIYVVDLATNAIVYHNRDEDCFLGYSADEFNHLPLTQILHPEDIAQLLEIGDHYSQMPDGRIAESEFRWFHKTNGMRWLNIRETIYERGVDGTPTQILRVIHDITERKEVEEQRSQLLAQLEAANRDLKDFAYIISHDLKAPLRGVNSIATWLAADYAGQFDAAGHELITLLVGRVRRMEQMINGVLEYSRVGRLTEPQIKIDLNRIVSDIVKDVVPSDQIAVVIEAPLPTLKIEPTRIRQVFQNLIDNAVKAIDKPAGEIRINANHEENRWVFSVRDNGIGIAAENFERIFQIFQTLKPRDEIETAGIGLTIVKRIIALYKGEIWLESLPGHGSTFYFSLSD